MAPPSTSPGFDVTNSEEEITLSPVAQYPFDICPASENHTPIRSQPPTKRASGPDSDGCKDEEGVHDLALPQDVLLSRTENVEPAPQAAKQPNLPPFHMPPIIPSKATMALWRQTRPFWIAYTMEWWLVPYTWFFIMPILLTSATVIV